MGGPRRFELAPLLLRVLRDGRCGKTAAGSASTTRKLDFFSNLPAPTDQSDLDAWVHMAMTLPG